MILKNPKNKNKAKQNKTFAGGNKSSKKKKV